MDSARRGAPLRRIDYPALVVAIDFVLVQPQFLQLPHRRSHYRRMDHGQDPAILALGRLRSNHWLRCLRVHPMPHRGLTDRSLSL